MSFLLIKRPWFDQIRDWIWICVSNLCLGKFSLHDDVLKFNNKTEYSVWALVYQSYCFIQIWIFRDFLWQSSNLILRVFYCKTFVLCFYCKTFFSVRLCPLVNLSSCCLELPDCRLVNFFLFRMLLCFLHVKWSTNGYFQHGPLSEILIIKYLWHTTSKI